MHFLIFKQNINFNLELLSSQTVTKFKTNFLGFLAKSSNSLISCYNIMHTARLLLVGNCLFNYKHASLFTLSFV